MANSRYGILWQDIMAKYVGNMKHILSDILMPFYIQSFINQDHINDLVFIKNRESKELVLHSGVPQGSVLGPVLFFICWPIPSI